MLTENKHTHIRTLLPIKYPGFTKGIPKLSKYPRFLLKYCTSITIKVIDKVAKIKYSISTSSMIQSNLVSVIQVVKFFNLDEGI